MILYEVQWEDCEYKWLRVEHQPDADQADVVQAAREAAEEARPGLGIIRVVRVKDHVVIWTSDAPPKPKPAPKPSSAVAFDPGRIVMTPGAMDALKRARQMPSEFILRHCCLEQGELDNSDHRSNASAMRCGLRVLSSFKTAKDDVIWLISEWVDVKNGGNPKKRVLTTLLLPGDY